MELESQVITGDGKNSMIKRYDNITIVTGYGQPAKQISTTKTIKLLNICEFPYA